MRMLSVKNYSSLRFYEKLHIIYQIFKGFYVKIILITIQSEGGKMIYETAPAKINFTLDTLLKEMMVIMKLKW